MGRERAGWGWGGGFLALPASMGAALSTLPPPGTQQAAGLCLCQGRVGLGARVVRGLLPPRGWGGGGCKRALLIPAVFQGHSGQLGAHTHPRGSGAGRSRDAPRRLHARPSGATGAST